MEMSEDLRRALDFDEEDCLHKHVPLETVGVRSVGPPHLFPKNWNAHLKFQAIPKETRDAIYNEMSPSGPPVVNTHDVCPQRYCNPSGIPNSSQTPIDNQARHLMTYADDCEPHAPTAARLLREAAERIEEQRATIDGLRKPMGTVPERE